MVSPQEGLNYSIRTYHESFLLDSLLASKVLHANENTNVKMLRGEGQRVGCVHSNLSLIFVVRATCDFELVVRRVAHCKVSSGYATVIKAPNCV
jgi:hypothetical protein